MTAIIHTDKKTVLNIWPLVLQQLKVTPVDETTPLKVEWEPVSGAYVVRIQTTLGGKARQTSLRHIQLGRTTHHGWVAARQEPNLEDVPSDSGTSSPDWVVRHGLPLSTGETYRIFWTANREELDAFLQALQLAASADEWNGLWDKHAPQQYRIVPASEPSSEDQKRLRDLGLQLNEQELILHIAFRDPTKAQLFHSKDLGGVWAAFMDVTPPAIRAMYAVEILEGYSAKECAARQHLSTLVRCKQIATMTAHCLPDAGMDAEQSKRTKQGEPEWVAFHAYRQYAWKCAALEVEKGDFEDSIAVFLSDPLHNWKNKAAKIGEATAGVKKSDGTRTPSRMRGVAGPATHPVFLKNELGLDDERIRLAGEAEANAALKAYFYMYSFGFRVLGAVHGASGPTTFESKVSKLLDRIQDGAGAQLRSIQASILEVAPYDEFVAQLDRSVRSDRTEERVWLQQRYFDVTANAGVRWWKVFENYEPPQWDEVKHRLTWMTGVAGGVAGALGNFYKRKLSEYNLGIEAGNEALNQLMRLELAAEGDTSSQVFTKKVATGTVEVRVDLEARTLTARKAGIDGVDVGPVSMEILVEEPDTFADPASTGGSGTRTKAKVWRRPQPGASRPVHVKVPFDFEQAKALGQTVPAGIGFVATFLNATQAVIEAQKQLSSGKVKDGQGGEVSLQTKMQLFTSLGKNALQLVSDGHGLWSAIQPAAQDATALPSPPPGATPSATGKATSIAAQIATTAKKGTVVAGKVTLRFSGVLDSTLSTGQGLHAIFSDDGEVALAARRGDVLRGSLQGLKGAMCVGFGTLGTLAAASELAIAADLTAVGFLGTAAGPVGWLLLVGAIGVFAVDRLIEATSDWDDKMEKLHDALDEALRKELGLESGQFLLSRRDGGASNEWAFLPDATKTSENIEYLQAVAQSNLTGEGPHSGG